MASTKKSVVTAVVHPSGQQVLKVSAGTSSLQQGSSLSISGVVQGTKVLDPAKVSIPTPSMLTPAPVVSAPAPATTPLSPSAVAPTSAPTNKYYIDLPGHNLTGVIAANSPEEAWRAFCTQKGIVATDREVLLTEFAP
jgi:hypothetical protein